MDATSTLAEQLTKASRKNLWDVYSYFQWPEGKLPENEWTMSPELVSIYGTEMWEALTEEQQKKLSFWEIINFFSLTLQGERPLVAGMSDRLYSSRLTMQETEYLHHFMDEENKHMIMFGMFCNRYAGGIYPEKKLVLPREYAKGEEDIAFFCKVMVVEELGDYYNLKMMGDERIHPLVAKINKVHHVDEARHLAVGREYLKDLAEQFKSGWSALELANFRKWLAEYLRSSWGDFYNPAVYRDAGLADSYNVRKMALESPVCRRMRETVSEKLVAYFLEVGLLEEAPPL
jgi:P-aminobenzoate N-oxygenase AurF